MKILIACEESQVVCKAFRAKGHEAYSCDILPCSGGHPEWHIHDKIEHVLTRTHSHTQNGDLVVHITWDLMIGHPECRYMANSGVCHIKTDPTRLAKVELAHNFFMMLWNANIPRICLENPIPHKYAKLPKYTQIIQPWMFGHMEQKATCLWLKNLPPLKETNNVREEMMKLPDNQRQRLHYLPPSKDRQRIRSTTFWGFAEGMAAQWSD